MSKKFQKILKEIRDAKENCSVLKYADQARTQQPGQPDHTLKEYFNPYPKLPRFEITDADLAQIEDLNNFPDRPLTSERQWTPFEKIFYAMLWKDGKLKSIKRIIEGMNAVKNGGSAPASKFVFVYHYFGRHLTNRVDEPLLDQHTMRACRRFQANKRRGRFTIEDAENYRSLFLDICKAENLKSYEDTRLVDSLFFALGKYAKRHPAS